MSPCPTCGADDPTGSARFCGRCGALLEPSVDAATTGRRRWWLVGGAAALVAVVGLVAWVPAEQPPAPGSGPTPGPTTAALWERGTRLELPLSDAVAPAGPEHVLVGGQVLATSADAPAELPRLPRVLTASALDDDRWAVVEGGQLVTGSLRAGVVTRTDLPAGLPVGGPARAWLGGDPVVVDRDGHLVRLGADGAVAWSTDRPVPSLQVAGAQWLLGSDATGATVAVAAADGTVSELSGRPLVVVGDVAVLQRDDVVGVDLRTGAVLWERPDVGGTWRTLAGQVVLEGPVAVVRIDPGSGATTGEVPRAAAVAVADGAAIVQGAELVAVDWDGAVTWTLPLADGVAHRPVAVDAGRVAVRSSGAVGTTVTVVDAAAGTVLASTPALPVALPPPGTGDDVVGLQLRGRARPLVLDVATGEVVDRPPPAMRRDRVQTPAGVYVLDAGAVSVRVTGPQGAWRALLDAPVATTPIPLTGSITVATTDGTIHRLDPARGDLLWQAELEVLPTAVAATAEDVHVGTADGRVLVLDDEGRTTGSIDVGAAVVALAAGGEVVVVVTADGVVRGYPR